MNYDEETLDFTSHGMTLYVNGMLGETEADHCEALFRTTKMGSLLGGKVVVDVGCGAGGLLTHLRADYPNNRYLGATNSQVQLDAVRKLGFEGVQFDLDAPDLPPADIFIFHQSIGHARSIPAVVADVARKLPLGGHLVINDFDAEQLWTAPTWQYQVTPFSHLLSAATANGLTLETLEFPPYDTTRYMDYWRASEYMKRAHGEPYGTKARVCVAVFSKSSEPTGGTRC